MIGKIGHTSGAGPISKTDRTCQCPVSDRWRCAVWRHLKSVACSCPCHRSQPPENRSEG